MRRQLDDWITGWLKYTENIESPPIFHKWVAISTIASLVGRNTKLMWDKVVYPNFYIFLVAPPGKARKGSAMYPAWKLIHEMEIPVAADSLTFERFVEFMASAKRRSQKITSIIDETCEVTIHSEELTNLLSHRKLDLIHALTKLYENPDIWRYETKNSGKSKITNSFLNLIGATQPQLIAQLLPEEAISGGFMSRVISVYEDRRGKIVIFPFENAPDKDLLTAVKEDAHAIQNMEGFFTIDQTFRNAWENWYPIQEKEIDLVESRLSHYVVRRPIHVLKLCMIFNISRNGGMEITGKDFKNALQLLKETEKKMSRTFAGMGQADHAQVSDLVSAYIYAAPSGTIRYKQILRSFYKEADEKILSQIIAVMEKIGDVEIEASSTDPHDFYIKVLKRNSQIGGKDDN